MAFVAADLDTIDTAIATGAVEVRFQDRTVRYNTTADLLLARATIYASLHPSGSAPAIVRQIRLLTSKGL